MEPAFAMPGTLCLRRSRCPTAPPLLRLVAALFIAWYILAPATVAWASEPASHYRVHSTDAAEIHQLTQLAVSEDGSLVAVGTLYGTVQVWDWRHATMVSSRKIDEEVVENLFFMDDDKRLTVLYSPDLGEQHMYVWEMATGAVADEDKVDGAGTGYFMPDGTIGMAHGGGIAFMDQKGKYAGRTIKFDDEMASLAVSPDGQFIAGGGYRKHYEQLVIRDTEGKLLSVIDTGFQPYDTVFSPDSKIVAVLQQENGGLGNAAEFDPSTNAYELFDVATGEKLRRFGGHDLFLSGAQFSPDGKRFLTWSGDRTLILWDMETGEMIHRLAGHRDSVSDGRFLGDGSLIVSSSMDGSMKIWTADEGRELVSMHALGEQTEPPSFIAIQPDGHFFEGGPWFLEVIKVQDGTDGPALTRKERQVLKLPAIEISAD